MPTTAEGIGSSPLPSKRRPSSTPGGHSSPLRSSTTPTPGAHSDSTSPCWGPPRCSRCSQATTRDHPRSRSRARARWLGFLSRNLKPKILQHPPVDPIGCPVDLSSHDPLAVGRWASAGRLDVAEVSGRSVELASEGLTGGPSPTIRHHVTRLAPGRRRVTNFLAAVQHRTQGTHIFYGGALWIR